MKPEERERKMRRFSGGARGNTGLEKLDRNIEEQEPEFLLPKMSSAVLTRLGLDQCLMTV